MQSILEAGGCPLIVPLRAGLHVQELREEALALLQGMHGLLVASEGDVDSLQGQLPWEIALCVAAVQSHLPLLAVGRGIRVLRTEELLTGLSFRPSLRHPGNGDGIYRGAESYHPVHIIAGSRLAQWLGTTYLQVASLYSQRNTSSHQQASRGLGDGVGALVVLCLAALLLGLGWAGMRQEMQRLLASEMQGALGRVASISCIGWPPHQERWVALAILVVGTALLEGCGERWLGRVRPWPAVPQALQQRTMLGGAILAIALSRMFAGPELLLLALACLIPLAASDALPRWYQEAATPLSAMDLEVRHLGRLWMWTYLELPRRRWLMVVMLGKFIVQGAMLGAVSLPLAAGSASAFMVAGFVQFPLPLTLLLAGFALNLLAWDASVPTLLGSPLAEMAKGRDERALWVVDLLGGLFLGVLLLVWQRTQQTRSTSLSPLLTQVGQGDTVKSGAGEQDTALPP